MAFTAIDMVPWDLLGNALVQPLFPIWGGTNTTIPSDEISELNIASFTQLLEKVIFFNNGNSRIKVQLSYETVEEEISHLVAVKMR